MSRLIATVFNIGHISYAPGTWASAAALGVSFLLKDYTLLYIFVFILLFLVGVKVSDIVEKEDGKKDPSYIVIDEFAAVFLVFLGVPLTPVIAVVGLGLFRLFDIKKVHPINKAERIPGGWGIMLDDIVAALYANLLLQLLVRSVIARSH